MLKMHLLKKSIMGKKNDTYRGGGWDKDQPRTKPKKKVENRGRFWFQVFGTEAEGKPETLGKGERDKKKKD